MSKKSPIQKKKEKTELTWKERAFKLEKMKLGLKIHLAVFIITNLMLFGINSIVSPFYLWFVFPFFGWMIAISLQLTAVLIFSRKVTNGLTISMVYHLVLFFSVNLLLIIIDNITVGKGITWSIFPLFFWGMGVAIHVAIGILYSRSSVELKSLSGKPSFKPKKGSLVKKLSTRIMENPITKKLNLLSKGSDEDVEVEPDNLPVEKPHMNAPLQINKKTPKKKKSPVEDATITKADIEELAKTESEVDVEEKEFFCIVHKGPIEGTLYLCPYCKTLYCVKCAKALKEKGEKCWSCNNELKP